MKFIFGAIFTPFTLTLYFILLLVFLCWLVLQHYYRIYKNYPPGPIPWPIIGNVLQIDPKHSYISFMNWSKEYYGKLMLVKLGFHRAVVINDPIRARELFNDLTFSGRPQCYFVTVLSGGSNGIVVSEGSVWEAQRRFTLRHLRDFGFGRNTMECLIMDSAQDFINSLKSREGKALSDLQTRLSLAVLNSLWTIVSGKRYSLDDPKLKDILTSLQEGQKAITRHPFLIVAPWIRYILPGLSGYNKFQQVVDRMVGYFRETIEEHKQELQETDINNPRDFIESYLKEIKATKDPSSSFYKEAGERNLRAVVGDLFQGGSETTGVTLTWAILFLMVHSEVQTKLQKEIDQVIGHKRLPTLYDRLKMPYTEAVIIETARMASVIPLGVFHSALADTYFHDYFIPKGAWIWTNQYAIHMDSHVWGDPENFNPERFLSIDGKFVLRSHESFMPFSVGKRECPGKSLANDTLFLFITSIFQRFTAMPSKKFAVPDILDSEDGFFRAPKKFSVKMKPRALTMNNPIFVIS